MTTEYRAQLATLVDAAPEGDQWLHELKYDGYRIGCIIDRGRVRLQSRRGNDWSAKFPEVCAAAERLPVKTALLDGEVAIVAKDGNTSFQALQNSFSGAPRDGLAYFVFDLLELDGRELRSLPLSQRKQELERLVKRAGRKSIIKFSSHIQGKGPLVLKRACELGAEGIVSKRSDQPYRPGRNEGWLKSKCVKRQEFVVGGFTDPEGSRQGIGSLLIGYHDKAGHLVFAGKVGTGRGFTAQYTKQLRGELQKLEQKQCPFTPRPPTAVGKNVHWVRPELVAEVAFAEWTEGGSVRHGSLQGFRGDKQPKQVTRERAKRRR
jgi:bifunctional non-homologous end joining protein LigD